MCVNSVSNHPHHVITHPADAVGDLIKNTVKDGVDPKASISAINSTSTVGTPPPRLAAGHQFRILKHFSLVQLHADDMQYCSLSCNYFSVIGSN